MDDTNDECTSCHSEKPESVCIGLVIYDRICRLSVIIVTAPIIVLVLFRVCPKCQRLVLIASIQIRVTGFAPIASCIHMTLTGLFMCINMLHGSMMLPLANLQGIS